MSAQHAPDRPSPFADTPAGASPLTERYRRGPAPTDALPDVVFQDFGRHGDRLRPQLALQAQAEQGVRAVLQLLGYDAASPDLKDTPARWVRAVSEMAGLSAPPAPADLDLTAFPDGGFDEMIVVPNIRWAALCPHHLLPYFGTAAVGYLPSPEARLVAGLSKLPRLVQLLAARLQTQESLTAAVADALAGSAIRPRGVGVRLAACHTCMSCRGAWQPGAATVTTALRGAFRQPEVKTEFFTLLGPVQL